MVRVQNEEIGKLLECIINNGVQCFEQQAKAVKASGDCADAALKWCDVNNRLQLKKLLEPLKKPGQNLVRILTGFIMECDSVKLAKRAKYKSFIDDYDLLIKFIL